MGSSGPDGRGLTRSVRVVPHPEATHRVEPLVGGRHDSSLTPVGARGAPLATGDRMRHRAVAGVADTRHPER